MIIFDGTKEHGKIIFMIFKNEQGSKVEVPIDKKLAQHFKLYFSLISPAKKEVEPETPVS
jgi:hypothetical protein